MNADNEADTSTLPQAGAQEPHVETPGPQPRRGKPEFGWDYCFVFRAPKFGPTKEKDVLEPASNETCDSDVDTDEYSPVNFRDTDEITVDGGNDGEIEVDAQLFLDPEKQPSDADVEALDTRCDIIARLQSAGFVFSQIYVPSENTVILRFSLTNPTLQEKAEKMGMELELKDDLGGGYMTFSRERRDCFKNATRKSLEEGCPYFCPSDRILIILATLQSKEHWGCDLDIERLVYKKKLLQAFAVHSKPEQHQLTRDVVYDRWWDPTWTPPFMKMKEYLGARVTLYFCFLSYYAKFLLPISALSIPAFVVTRVLDNQLVIAALRCMFGASVVLWTTLFLERWKRRFVIRQSTQSRAPLSLLRKREPFLSLTVFFLSDFVLHRFLCLQQRNN